MKKFTKMIALLAGLSLSLAAFGFAACGTSEEGVSMTEQEVQKINSAFSAMEVYSGGYSIYETSSTELTWDNQMFADSEGGFASVGTVTYDQSTGNMAYTAVIDGTGVYDGLMDMEADYYTIKNSDASYTQYVKMVYPYANVNYSRSTDYTEIPELYFDNYGNCVSELFNIDLSAGADVSTAQGYALFFEEMLNESISTISDSFGFEFSFVAGDCSTWLDGEDTVYRFSASATASVDLYTDELSYTIDVYLDTSDAENFRISKIDSNVVQIISVNFGDNFIVNATATTTSSDIFTYEYDSSVMPTDFSGYTAI